MRHDRPRHAILPFLLVVALLVSACGDPDSDAAADDVGEEDNAQDTTTVDNDLTDPLVGLEVTVAGNVSEVVDDNAFRVDKDGLGEPTGSSEEEIIGDVDDYDDEYFDRDTYYYDYEYGTAYDDEFDDADTLAEGVLVLDLNQTDVQLEDGVRVNGTIRRFAETTLEDVYDVDLNNDLYDPYEDHLVIVATNVRPLKAPAGDSESPAAAPGASATMTPTDG